LVAEIEKAFGRRLPLATVFEEPTVECLARALDGATAERGGPTPDEDVLLAASIQPSAATVTPGTERDVLLTGATGFVGAHLLHELLDRTDVRVHCLVRPAAGRGPLERIAAALEGYACPRRDLYQRVVPIAGDLAAPRFGLSAEAFERLSQTVDAIYHGGAHVHFNLSYQKLRAANVLGTQEVLRLAACGRWKPLHYLSTLGIFPPRDDRRPIVEEEEPERWLEAHQPDGYRMTKWVSERLMSAARERGLPVVVYRLGRITGHSVTGAVHQTDLFVNMVKGCIQLGSAPSVEGRMDMTPVDYACSAIVQLSKQPTSLGRVFHLINPRPASWQLMVERVRAFGYPVESVTPEAWLAALLARREADNAMSVFADFVMGSMAFGGEERVDDRNTQAALAATPVRCPAADERLLDRYLVYLGRSGFLPRTGSRP
jgi:thioester reductase-like protein